MTSARILVHQSIAQSVLDHGIETIFGLMGDANMFMVDHYVRAGGKTFVPVAHEGSGVLMALAWSHVTGRIGVATATHGPALTNCVTALTEGARGRVPMVLLVGDTPIINPNHDQSTDQREVVKVTGAGFEQIRAPETASRDVARAFYRARVERRPIVVNMPAELMWQETEHETVVLKSFRSPAFVPEGDDLDEAVGMIASARRPVILAGGGAVGAREQLISLADRLEAPLATDPPPLKWSAVMFRKTEDQNGYEAAQAGRDCHEAAAG